MSIFVSYSRLDEAVVKELARGLEAADREVWFDNDLSGGEVWWVKILDSIRQADVVMFGLSDHALRSKPCRAELDYAMALNRAILPIKVGPVANFRANPLSAIQTLEFRPDNAFTAFEIIGAVDDAFRRTLPLPDPPPLEPQMPYAYLAQLSKQIDTEQQLSPQVQIDAVDELRKAFREETDETVHADIKEILRRLKSKPWATVQTAGEIDAVFEWIERREQAARTPGMRGTSSGSGPTTAPVDKGPSSRREHVGQPPGSPIGNRPTGSQVTDEDTRRELFEERLAGLMRSEQEKARVRREEHKRAAADRSAAGGSTSSRQTPQPPLVTEPRQSSSPPADAGASATRQGQPEDTGAGAPGPRTGGATDTQEDRRLETGGASTRTPGSGETTGSKTHDASATASPFELKSPFLPPPRSPQVPPTGSPAASPGGWNGPASQASAFSAAAPLGRAGPASQAQPAHQTTSGSWTGVSAATQPQPTSGSATPPQPTSGSPPPRPNWAWCIVALPTVAFGIIALYWAAQVHPRLARGDIAGARRASGYARGWGIAGLVVLLVALVGYLLVYLGAV